MSISAASKFVQIFDGFTHSAKFLKAAQSLAKRTGRTQRDAQNEVLRCIIEMRSAVLFRHNRWQGDLALQPVELVAQTGHPDDADALWCDFNGTFFTDNGDGTVQMLDWEPYQKAAARREADAARNLANYHDAKNDGDAASKKRANGRARVQKHRAKAKGVTPDIAVLLQNVTQAVTLDENLKRISHPAKVPNSADCNIRRKISLSSDFKIQEKNQNQIHPIPLDPSTGQDHMPHGDENRILTAEEAWQAAGECEEDLRRLGQWEPAPTPEPVMDDAKAKKPKEEDKQPAAKQPTAPSGKPKGKTAANSIYDQVMAMGKRLAVSEAEVSQLKVYDAAKEDGACPAGQQASKAKAKAKAKAPIAAPKSAFLPWPAGIPKPQNLAAHPSPQELGAFCSAVGWHAKAQRMHLLEAQLVGLTWADLQAAWADGRPKSLGYAVLLTMSQRGVANPREALERLKCSLRYGSETSLTSTPKDAPQANHTPLACPKTGRADPLLH